jgi:hypothetical protein
MKDEFKAFLRDWNCTEEEYNHGTFADKVEMIDAFEKSKQGEISFIAFIR